MKPERRLRALRQASICLWVLFAWARDAGNLEAAYRSAELLLLQAWQIARQYADKSIKTAHAVSSVYGSIFATYQQISIEYLSKCVTPHSHKLYGLSTAVHASSSQDVNLKLYDVLGRTSLFGIWCWCHGQRHEDGSKERSAYENACRVYADALKNLIDKNPALHMPLIDDQCIDISLATLLLALTGDEESIANWLSGIVDRAIFAYRTNKAYPCTLRSYSELLEHPMRDEQYRKTVTEGSILFPFIAVIAACLRHTDIYEAISKLKSQELDACTFQYWYPDSTSEENIYITGQGHGAVVTDVAVERPMEELLDQMFGECANMPQYGDQRAAAAQLLAGWHSSGVCEQGKDRPP